MAGALDETLAVTNSLSLPLAAPQFGLAATLAAEASPSASPNLVASMDPALLATATANASPSSPNRSPASSIEPSIRATWSRGTVLPSVRDGDCGLLVHHEPRDRYEAKGVLGEGGMGEVTLAEDHDIGRSVALKWLKKVDPTNVARFVEEIRTVGALEHPNIVPIHDVGVDEQGRYFFVMKRVEGEALDEVIAKLAAGDPDYHRRYTFEVRTQIFLGLLRALDYAHTRNIVHRDIKPANVMVGPFGEVMLMDWGVAKRGGAKESPDDVTSGRETSDERVRLFSTQKGSLVGTPAYMSPEQAQGKLAELDERSDLYSACVLFHELLTTRHYLAEQKTLGAMLVAITSEPFSRYSMRTNANPHQKLVPAELMHLIEKGLKKAPGERFQTANELIGYLQASIDGHIQVHCVVTMQKRMGRELTHWMDNHPRLSLIAMSSLLGSTLFTLGFGVYRIFA